MADEEQLKKSIWPPKLVLVLFFIFSLFWVWTSGIREVSFFLYAMLGILALYWIYYGSEKDRKYVKDIAYFSIIYGVILIIFGLFATENSWLWEYWQMLASNIIEPMKIMLISDGIIVVIFGVLLYLSDKWWSVESIELQNNRERIHRHWCASHPLRWMWCQNEGAPGFTHRNARSAPQNRLFGTPRSSAVLTRLFTVLRHHVLRDSVRPSRVECLSHPSIVMPFG